MSYRPPSSMAMTLLALALRNRRKELGLSYEDVERTLRSEEIDGPSYETVERGRAPQTLALHCSAYAQALKTSTPALLSWAARFGFCWSTHTDGYDPGVWTVPAMNESRARFIRDRRLELGMTQEELAAEMRRLSPELDPFGPEDRTNKESITNIERGRKSPSTTKIVLLAGALRVTPLELCAVDPDIDPEEYLW